VVSHKPSTLATMDKILVMKDGQVAMFGPRNEVFQKIMPGAARQQPPQQQRPQIFRANTALGKDTEPSGA
ncbi:MAG: hypothetical protein ACOCWR_05975, partial [Oceanidesulfovibrio sp.]